VFSYKYTWSCGRVILMMFENKVLRVILGLRKDDVTKYQIEKD